MSNSLSLRHKHCEKWKKPGSILDFEYIYFKTLNDSVKLFLFKYKIYTSICPPISKSTVMIFGSNSGLSNQIVL